MEKKIEMKAAPAVETKLILPEGEKVVNKGTVMNDEQTSGKKEEQE